MPPLRNIRFNKSLLVVGTVSSGEGGNYKVGRSERTGLVWLKEADTLGRGSALIGESL